MSLNRDQKNDSKTIFHSAASDSKKNNAPAASAQITLSDKTIFVKTSSEPKKPRIINPTSGFEKILGQDPVMHNIMSYFVESSKTQNNIIKEEVKQPIKEPITKSDRLKTASAFMQTSRPNPLTDLFKKNLLEATLKRRARVLCQCVVYGNYDQVKAILDKIPKLVLYKAKVKDYCFYEEENEIDTSGMKKCIYRKSEGTALQLALAAEDVSRKDHPDEGMADLIISYFVKAFNNDEKAAHTEITKQFEEQFPKDEFPECYEIDEKKREEIIKQKNANHPDIKVIEDIQSAVNLSGAEYSTSKKLNENKELQNALKTFRKHFKPTDDFINKGKHFNVQILINTLQLYEKKLKEFDYSQAYTLPAFEFFWDKVIQYVARFVPTWYAQAFAMGLSTFVSENKKLERKLSLRHGYHLPNDPADYSEPLSFYIESTLEPAYTLFSSDRRGSWNFGLFSVWGNANELLPHVISSKSSRIPLLYATSKQKCLKDCTLDKVKMASSLG